MPVDVGELKARDVARAEAEVAHAQRDRAVPELARAVAERQALREALAPGFDAVLLDLKDRG